MATDPKPMRVQEFISRLKHMLEKHGDFQLAWFLGAGCSVTSDIPAAKNLVKGWLTIRHGGSPSNEELAAWTRDEYPKFTGDYAALYGEVVEQLFATPEERQMEVECLMLGKQPGFGYATLAQLINQEHVGQRCNTVLTVNFDDLVADALYLYAGQRPRLIAHESLMHYVRGGSTRPTVVKLHGDTYLGAKNTKMETSALAESAQQALARLVGERAVVFLGYGGNDQSIADAFAALPEGAPKFGVYWVGSKLPGGDLGKWLRARGVRWVENNDFDELMLMLRTAFDLPLPSVKPFEAMVDNFRRRFEELSRQVEQAPASKEKEELTAALVSVVQKAKDWWGVELETRKYKLSDPGKAEELYHAGLKKFPDSAPLLGSYANFLCDQLGRFQKAETYYQRSLESDPKNANVLGSYAVFLQQQSRLDEAEQFYKRALESDPKHANTLGNYGVFLKQQGRLDEAEQFYKRALESDPKHAGHLGNYAILLQQQGRLDEAEQFYKRALEIEPKGANKHGNYAGLLLGLGREDGAELLEQAMQLAEVQNEKVLLLECLLYADAHDVAGEKRQEWRERMCALLAAGVRSKGWDFSLNINRAEQDGHPDVEILKLFADVISDKKPYEALVDAGVCQAAAAAAAPVAPKS